MSHMVTIPSKSLLAIWFFVYLFQLKQLSFDWQGISTIGRRSSAEPLTTCWKFVPINVLLFPCNIDKIIKGGMKQWTYRCEVKNFDSSAYSCGSKELIFAIKLYTVTVLKISKQ